MKMHVSPRNLIFPLLAVFSASSMGVILIYYLNKKNNEQSIKNDKVSQCSKEIKIPRQFIPAIIGRRGMVIENIQLTTCTIISFKEEKDVHSPERICIISGSKENIKLAEEKINDIIKNQPIIESFDIYVPQRTVNSITERGNEILNQIQNSSNAKIVLDQYFKFSDLDKKKRVIIMGTAEQIAKASSLIEDKIQEDKEMQVKTDSSSITRASRIKTSSVSKSNLIDLENSRDIFANQENEGLMEVFVCAVDNPSQFYIQVTGPGNALLDDLIEEMTEYYESKENRELHTLKNITVGQMVAVKFSIDNKWYRAEIIAECDNKYYDVYFVDFGDREKICQDNIFELRTDFLSLRLQAIECCLADVNPRNDKWTSEAAVIFGNLCALGNWQIRIAKIKGYKERGSGFRINKREGSPIPCIELYERFNDQLVNIGKELVKLELACDASESWSTTTSTPSKSRRTKSPQGITIEEIDLTNTPKTKENVEVIDLTTPSKKWNTDCSTPSNDWKTESCVPSYFNEKKNSPIMWKNNDKITESRNTSVNNNPFKRNKEAAQNVQRNIIPAGYESELSDSDSDFEMYT